MSDRPPDPDPDALAYARYWEPVLAAPAHRLLTRVSTVPMDYLDIGCGTGSLPLAAATRWPDVRIAGLDASAGMLSVARQRVATGLAGDEHRFAWIAADAARMPMPDASIDVVTSAFMLQLVDDRPAVLREVRRVLRPGGTFVMVTWIAEELVTAADDAFDSVVRELGLEWANTDFRPGRARDFQDIEEARRELHAAGFEAVDAGADEVRYAWTRADYLEFKERYDEYELFESLGRDDRARLHDALTQRWSDLPDAAFTVRGPLVQATARRPGDGSD